MASSSARRSGTLIEDGDLDLGWHDPQCAGAVEALRGGVAKVTIMNRTVPHAILLELLDEGSVQRSSDRSAS